MRRPRFDFFLSTHLRFDVSGDSLSLGSAERKEFFRVSPDRSISRSPALRCGISLAFSDRSGCGRPHSRFFLEGVNPVLFCIKDAHPVDEFRAKKGRRRITLEISTLIH